MIAEAVGPRQQAEVMTYQSLSIDKPGLLVGTDRAIYTDLMCLIWDKSETVVVVWRDAVTAHHKRHQKQSDPLVWLGYQGPPG
jgi:hypothetical protein